MRNLPNKLDLDDSTRLIPLALKSRSLPSPLSPYSEFYTPGIKAVFAKAAAKGQLHPSPSDWLDQIFCHVQIPLPDPAQTTQTDSLKQLQLQLPILKAAGISTVCLSPLLNDPPQSTVQYVHFQLHELLRVNRHYSTASTNPDQDLVDLVNTAHELGLYVMLELEMDYAESALQELAQHLPNAEDLQIFLILAHQYVIARFDLDGLYSNCLSRYPTQSNQTLKAAIEEYALSIGKQNLLLLSKAEEVFLLADQTYPTELKQDYYGNLSDVLTRVLYAERPISTWIKYFLQATYSHENDKQAELIKYDLCQTDDNYKKIMVIASLISLDIFPSLQIDINHLQILANPILLPQLSQLAALRLRLPALRYGRKYFRPVSVDGYDYAISQQIGGVIAWSRILHHQEIIIIINTHPNQSKTLDIIADLFINQPGDSFQIVFSNHPYPKQPAPLVLKRNVNIQEADGSIGHGPIHSLRVTLQSGEVQILEKDY